VTNRWQMRLRALVLVAAVTLAASALATVPSASPALAHGGSCDAFARKPRIVSGRDMEVFGSFWCPRGHQKISITVVIQGREPGGKWGRWRAQSVSRSGGTSIGHSYKEPYYCDYQFRTVVKGLAGSSGTTTHSRTVRSKALKASCA
jgi:hypothetical protein